MTKEEKIEEIRQRARKNFSLGYNCAECVTEAVLSLVDTGLPPSVKKVATGFGGGIGLFGDTCGALAGAVMAVSAVHGRDSLPEGADQKDVAMKSKAQFYGKPGVYRIFNRGTQSLQGEIRKDPVQGIDGAVADHLAVQGTRAVLP